MPEELKSELAKALEARKRKSFPLEVGGILGLGNKPIRKIRVRVPTKKEEEMALVGAHGRIADLAGDLENAKNDPDIMNDAKAMEIIQQACLSDDGKIQAFPGGKWMREHFTGDQVGMLLNMVNEVRFKEGPVQWDFSREKIDAIINLCVRASSSDIPERVLIGYQREYLTSLVCYLAVRLWSSERMAGGRPGVAVERNEDGTFNLKFEEGDGPDFEPLPEGFVDDPDDFPDVADAVPDEDEKGH